MNKISIKSGFFHLNCDYKTKGGFCWLRVSLDNKNVQNNVYFIWYWLFLPLVLVSDGISYALVIMRYWLWTTHTFFGKYSETNLANR